MTDKRIITVGLTLVARFTLLQAQRCRFESFLEKQEVAVSCRVIGRKEGGSRWWCGTRHVKGTDRSAFFRSPFRSPMIRYKTRLIPRNLFVARRQLHYSRPWNNELYDPKAVERIEDEVDVCIVGAGPAGLSAAIRIKQLEREKGKEIRVVVLEKGGEVGQCSSYFLVSLT